MIDKTFFETMHNDYMAKSLTDDEIEIKAWHFVLGTFLADYPDDIDPSTINEYVYAEDFDKVVFWKPFEDWSGEELAEVIESTFNGLMRLINEVKNENN